MTLAEIRATPTIVDTRELASDDTYHRIHESTLRSFHIVNKVQELLEANTPAPVLLQIIEDLKGRP